MLVILPILLGYVGKQLVLYSLIGHHVLAVGFVQDSYWIKLLKPIVFCVNKQCFRKSLKYT